MQICCTKKLLDQIGGGSQEGLEENDLFCWSAHLITVNRRKTMVVVNDSNRFGFILYGLKSKDFKNFSEMIHQGIRECLRDEKVKEEIIEAYLLAAGDMFIGKTRGRNYVARLNKACEQGAIFDDLLITTELFQHKASRRLNYELIKCNKNTEYTHPYELLNTDLRNFAGEETIRCRSIDLIIKLDLGRYTAFRRIIAPEDISFLQLHDILQIAFDWKDYHLYEFNVLDKTGNSILNVISENEDLIDLQEECTIQLDSEVKLRPYIKKHQKILYCYDYGDSWEHEIFIQDIIEEYDKNYPICVLGEGNAPPEDVGGVSGYEYFLDIMANPEDGEYMSTKRWAEGQRYREFDIGMVNRRLKNILR